MNCGIFFDKQWIHSPQVACAISNRKSAFRTFLSIVLISRLLVVYYSVCALAHISLQCMCMHPFDRKTRFLLSCLVTLITQVWRKILSWNFVQVSKKYIPTPSENIIIIHLTTSFYRLANYSQLSFGHLVQLL